MRKENGLNIADLQISSEDRDLLYGIWWDGRYWRRKEGRIHRIIAERIYGYIDHDLVVDHVNRNPGDNSRVNLRVVPQSVNVRNSDGKSSIRKSKYRGVFKARNKWAAQITMRKIRRCLGTFATEELAAKAYRNAEILYCGLAGVVGTPWASQPPSGEPGA